MRRMTEGVMPHGAAQGRKHCSPIQFRAEFIANCGKKCSPKEIYVDEYAILMYSVHRNHCLFTVKSIEVRTDKLQSISYSDNGR